MKLESLKDLIDDKFEKREDIVIRLKNNIFEKKLTITTHGNKKGTHGMVITKDGPFWIILKHYDFDKLTAKIKIYESAFSIKDVEEQIMIITQFYIGKQIKFEKEFHKILEKAKKS